MPEGPHDAENAGDDSGDGWPSTFPHAAIDQLLDRIDQREQLESVEVQQVLRLIAREAHRLRASVVRLTVEKLSAADREAAEILEHAVGTATSLRTAGLAALDSRLDEADRLSAEIRAMAWAVSRPAGPRSGTRQDRDADTVDPGEER